jgi:uncharacterized glyoxalase superfamily protein PhnB
MIVGMFPFLEARDVAATVELYCRWLGFERVGSAEEEANGVFAVRGGGVHIAFVQAPVAGDALGTGVRFYFDVDDVEGHHARAREGGATVVDELADKPYRMREYTLRDPNGYRLTFAQPISPRDPQAS